MCLPAGDTTLRCSAAGAAMPYPAAPGPALPLSGHCAGADTAPGRKSAAGSSPALGVRFRSSIPFPAPERLWLLTPFVVSKAHLRAPRSDMPYGRKSRGE